jgi:hypothetical protein
MDQLSSSAIAAMSAKRWRVSALVKGFGCRPHAGGAACAVGRRPKASKGGNRGNGYVCGAACAMGIWVPQVMRLSGVDAIECVGRW